MLCAVFTYQNLCPFYFGLLWWTNAQNWSLVHLLKFILSQLCVWNSDGWEKQKNRFLQIPTGRTSSSQSDTRVQFHQDQIHFLVVHETQLAIYETTKLECVKQVFFYIKDMHLGRSVTITCCFVQFCVFNVILLSCSGSHESLLHQSLMRHSRVIASWYTPAS